MPTRDSGRTPATNPMISSAFDQVWQWEGSWWRPVYRKGQRCRILVWAPAMNSVLVEFEDGFKVNTSRWAVRPVRQGEVEQSSFF
jgi:hypothetical protein